MKQASIASRLNRLPVGRLHRKATVVVGIGTFFDLFDIFLSSVLSTVLAKQFHVSSGQMPLLLGAGFLGMFFGAIVIGRLADRIGRRRAFLINLAVYSLFTLCGAFSTSVTALIVFRVIAGIGLGAEPPLADTYLSEILPSAQRGRYIALAYTIGFLGMPCMGFLAKGLVPTQPLGVDGWRWIFVIGALGSIVVWFLRRSLPESPRWLESVGRTQEAESLVVQFEEEARSVQGKLPAAGVEVATVTEAFPFSRLFGREFRGRTIMLYIFQLFQTFGYYGFGTLVPIVLAAKGFNLSNSLLFTALSFLGYPLGSLLSVPMVERMERKRLVVLSALLMGVFGLAFGMSSSSFWIVCFGFFYTLVSNIFSNAYHIYQAEIFPTSVRATAAGSAYSLSRLMSGLMPFVLLPVLKQYGSTTMFGVVAVAMLIIMLDIGLLGPRTTGRSLEQVNEARTQAAAGDGTNTK